MTSVPTWDIFCRVIDNHGDLGVCWRLSRQLAARGLHVRLWVDDASALAWMAPAACPGVEIRPWVEPFDLHAVTPGDVLVEAFGCEVPLEFVAAFAQRAVDKKTAWINLEYLSAESYVERSHGLPSPVMSGPGRGLIKHFFYPGFTPRTGGLLREPDLLQRQARFDRKAWLSDQGLPNDGRRLVSLFCYEPPALPELLTRLSQAETTPTRLLVTAGRAAAAVRACALPSGLDVCFLPYLPQDDYDHLLWTCDLNFVRGEDSLVRALWAGRPFVWHIYPQHDDAHHAKLAAFLDCLDAPDTLRVWHRRWNAVTSEALSALDLPAWAATTTQARDRLWAQDDLLTQLLEFVAGVG